MEIYRLYPQYTGRSDRRECSVPVEVERRSGIDRRQNQRPFLEPKLKQDIQLLYHNIPDMNIKNKRHNDDVTALAFGSIPFARRFLSIKDAFVSGDIIKAVGKVFTQVINLEEDKNDVTNAAKQLMAKDFKVCEYQNPFSFTKGTLLESDNRALKQLYDLDKTLFDTKFCQNLLDKFKIKYSFIDSGKADKLGNAILSYKMEGNFLKKVFGRSLLRIPLLGVGFLALLEIPAIFRAENHSKQILKSAVNVSSITLVGALVGSACSFLGPSGSLIGLGIGSWLGSKLAGLINGKT